MSSQYLFHRRTASCAQCPTPCLARLQNTLDLSKVDEVCQLDRWSKPLEVVAPVSDSAAIQRPVAAPDKSVWGPPMWAALHAEAEKNALTPEKLQIFGRRVPCGECRTHWSQVISATPFRPENQYQWSVDVHNAVNVLLGKPIWPPPETLDFPPQTTNS